jgi:hypothetical protein
MSMEVIEIPTVDGSLRVTREFIVLNPLNLRLDNNNPRGFSKNMGVTAGAVGEKKIQATLALGYPVINPIHVTPDEGEFLVIEGHRRTKAARQQGLTQIGAMNYPDITKRGIAALRNVLHVDAIGTSWSAVDKFRHAGKMDEQRLLITPTVRLVLDLYEDWLVRSNKSRQASTLEETKEQARVVSILNRLVGTGHKRTAPTLDDEVFAGIESGLIRSGKDLDAFRASKTNI